MSVELESAARLAALRDKANATTGEAADTLAGAVEALIAGYGQGGGEEDEDILIGRDDVTFYDYDGTVVVNYTQDEVAKLTELPVPPQHDGLVFQEWNWTLDEIKALGRRAIVGANYDTADGKTRVHINITREDCLTLGLSYLATVNNAVVVDWGDGSAPETPAPVGGTTSPQGIYAHTYPALGRYVITLDCTSGTFEMAGYENNGGGYQCDVIVMPKKQYRGNKKFYDCVTMLEIGSKCTKICGRSENLKKMNVPTSVVETYTINAPFVAIPRNANLYSQQNAMWNEMISLPGTFKELKGNEFSANRSLRDIVIPDGATTIPNNCFENCDSLADITIPDSVTTIGQYGFRYCPSLTGITIPDNVTTVGSGSFAGCSDLCNVTIGKNVTRINGSAFNNCIALEVVVCKSPAITFDAGCFGGDAYNKPVVRYYDFTAATVTDGVLSYTFSGGNIFQNIKAGSIIMFATAEIAEVAKTTTNLSAYASYIHYVGEEGVEWL
jgi:hypothetical protein